MPDDIYQSPQCSCSAFFPTDDALNNHLEEYTVNTHNPAASSTDVLKSQERYLRSLLEICRAHSRANGEVEQDNGNDNGDQKNSNGKAHYCPLTECDRNTRSFKTRQALRVHFEQRKYPIFRSMRGLLTLQVQTSNARRYVCAVTESSQK
jgi:hypothetical protein